MGNGLINMKIGDAPPEMNWLEFISSVVGSIAWPLATFAIAFLLRDQIRQLIQRIKRLAVGENAVDFSERLDEAEAISAGAANVTDADPETLALPGAKMQQLIALSPSAAVLEAWKEIEVRTIKLAEPYHSSAGLNRDGRRPYNVRASANALLKAGLISPETYALVLDLTQLRNAAAHSDDVTASDAVRFVQLAEVVKTALRSVPGQNN